MASASLLSSCHRTWADSVYVAAKRGPPIGKPGDDRAVADTVRMLGLSRTPRLDDRDDDAPAANRDGLAIGISFVIHLIAVAAMTLAWPAVPARPSSANGAMAVTFVTANAVGDRVGEKTTIGRRAPPAMTGRAAGRPRLPGPDRAEATPAQAPVAALPARSDEPGAEIATSMPPDEAGPPAGDGLVPAAGKPATTPMTVVAGRSAEEANWEQSVMSRLALRKRYPTVARNAGLSDEIMLRLIIDREGHLLAAEIARSRGISLLDKAALDMAARSSPYPAPPSSVAGDAIRLLVPVQFLIRAR